MGRRDPYVVSATMRLVRSKDTTPEKVLRKALWSEGFRFRLHYKRLAGKPDIVFPSAQVAVFVDGDFWHGNQWRLRGLSSLEKQFEGSDNAPYWVRKIQGNVIRDSAATTKLEGEGWHVIRLWESELKKDLEACVKRVSETVSERKRIVQR